MAGLIIDLSGPRPRLATTDEMDIKTGKLWPPKWDPPKDWVPPDPRVSCRADDGRAEGQGKPRGRTRSANPPTGAEYQSWSTPEVLGKAKSLGYVEKPWPNGGIRRMRALNYLKHHGKDAK